MPFCAGVKAARHCWHLMSASVMPFPDESPGTVAAFLVPVQGETEAVGPVARIAVDLTASS